MTNTKDKFKYVGEFVYNYKHNGYDTQTENSLKSIDGLTIVCIIEHTKLSIGFISLPTTDLDTISKVIKLINDIDYYDHNNLNGIIIFGYYHPSTMSRGYNFVSELYNNIPECILQELVLNDVRCNVVNHPNASEKINRLVLMMRARSLALRVEEITNALANEHL
jgi:hypothetical protein